MSVIRAILVVAVLMVLVPFAQAGVRYGLKGGMNLSNVYSSHVNLSTDGDMSSRLGKTVGALVLVPLSGRSDFQIEVLYSQEGFSFPTWNYYGRRPYTGTIALDYIKVPVLWRCRLSPSTCTGLFTLLGFSAAGPVSFKLLKPDWIGDDRDVQNDASMEVAAVAGVGVHMPVSFGGIDAEFRYSISLGEAFDGRLPSGPGSGVALQGAVSNNSFYFTINLLFPGQI